MIKKTLPAAIALAGGLGLAGAAHAVNVNHDGLGEVLLYSLYTTEGGNDSLINITNTSNVATAVKVRFLEGMNSQEVLDFNLYLSPHDVWVASVSRSATGAMLKTSDTSCTVPMIPAAGVEFRNTQYQGVDYSRGQGGPQGTDRTRVGYVEVIQMGTLTNDDVSDSDAFNPALWATHVAGVPTSCAKLNAAWTPPAGLWISDSPNIEVSSPLGGLYGSMVLVDVNGGTDVAYDATAIDNWSEGTIFHTAPGSLLPSLDNGGLDFALPDGTTGSVATGADAVSVVLQKASDMNDYVTVASLAAGTDWNTTFPTKKFYSATFSDALNNASGLAPADGLPDMPGWDPEPFTMFWNSELGGSACEPINIDYWDREEKEPTGGIDFSPTTEAAPISLCWEANIISINGSNVLGGGYTLNSLGLPEGFDAGWIRFNYTGTKANAKFPTPTSFTRHIETSVGFYDGLPSIGFAVIEFTNGDVGGLLSNYAGLTVHKSEVQSHGG